MTRTFCSGFVLVLCSLLLVAAPSAHAQKKVTVAAELKRLQAEGADPAAITAYRATYDVFWITDADGDVVGIRFTELNRGATSEGRYTSKLTSSPG